MVDFLKFFIIGIVFVFSGCDDVNTQINTLNPEVINSDEDYIHPDKNKIKSSSISEIKAVKKRRVNPTKEKFKKIMVPIVTEVYKELDAKYHKIKNDIALNRNKDEIERLKKEYKAKNNQLLLHAIKPHPISIVLAQSAIESAWLGSRFAKDANNIFGVWSFSKNEPRIAATGARGDKIIYLKKYNSYKEAVRDYYKSIGKSWAYKKLRYLRTHTQNSFILLPHLKSYSEKGQSYLDTLKDLIKYNEFEKYDIKDN